VRRVSRGISAIAFAVTGMASGTNEWDQPLGARRLTLLGDDGLNDLRENGVEIGCRSRTHRQLGPLEDAQLASETGGAAQDLERAGLPRPKMFAYPYGECTREAARAVRDAGFAAGFGLARGLVNRRSDPFNLPRLEILARDRGWRFRAKTAFPRLSAAICR